MPYRLSRQLLLLVISIVILVSTSRATAISPTSTHVFIEPKDVGVTLPEMDEFATMVLGDPWDMNQPNDLAYYRIDSLTNSVFTNGVYSAQMTVGDGRERITLLTAGAPNNTALRIGNIGYNFPINANHYRYLSYRIYKSHPDVNSGLIQWFADDSYTNASMGVSNGVMIPAGAGWHTIVVDLHTIGIQQGGKNWEGTIRELIIKPFAGPGAAGATVKLDWARLTAGDPRTARPYTMQWTPTTGTYAIFASLDDRVITERDILLKSGVSGNSGNTVIQTGILPAGTYFLAMKDTNGVVTWSPGPLVINTVPEIEFISPSMSSGSDYASEVLGNSWDMNDIDLNNEGKPWQRTCVQNESYNNGIYTAQLYHCPNTGTYIDPILYLGHMDLYPAGTQQDPIIDTRKYRYLTFRYYLAGEQNVTHGWVGRFGWWQVAADDGNVTQGVVMSRDIILMEGWNTYKIDLWAADIVDEVHPIQRSWIDSAPNRLRFDPAELAYWLTPATIQIDWIKLAAVETINRGDSYLVKYNLQSEDPVNITFYYDTDTNPNNGRVVINNKTMMHNSNVNYYSNTTVNNIYNVYLPIVMNNYCTGDCFYWHTNQSPPGGLANGDYYICAEIDDGLNSIYRCSETTVTVR